ncbi:MAG: hypothetical protein Q8R55_06175 [Candidatus Taylorbacteria bacterium]|nr:hypothetical protein [Candidatus Taylorbacteria bacterium]
MRKHTQEGNLRVVEKNNWQLAYTEEFKAFVHEHPSVIKDVVAKLSNLVNSGALGRQVIEEDGIKITTEKQRIKSNTFSVELHGRKFFLKMGKYLEGGYDEITSAAEAKRRIDEIQSDLPIGVEVIDYQLGFTQGGLNFFIAPWEDIDHLSEYQEKIKGDKDKEEAFDKTITILVGMFQDFEDFRILNMGYNTKTNKIVLYDLHKKK